MLGNSYLTWSLFGLSLTDFGLYGHCRCTAMPLWALSTLCLVGHFASWASLPLGLLCLLSYFAFLGYTDTLPLGLCLIDTIYFDNAGILLCLMGCAITGHLLVCQMISYVNMSNWDTL
jgi:hypothetical protein